jgi:hypothetical protein
MLNRFSCSLYIGFRRLHPNIGALRLQPDVPQQKLRFSLRTLSCILCRVDVRRSHHIVKNIPRKGNSRFPRFASLMAKSFFIGNAF